MDAHQEPICRQEFESWCKKQRYPNFSLMPWPEGPMREDGLYDGPVVKDGQYFAPQTQAGWTAWQAAWQVWIVFTGLG